MFTALLCKVIIACLQRSFAKLLSRVNMVVFRTVNKPLSLMEGEGKVGSSIALMTLYLLGVGTYKPVL